MRSYPPSLNASRFLCSYLSATPKEPREEMQRGKRSGSRYSRLESVPSSVLKRFRSNFEVGRRGVGEGPLERFREHNGSKTAGFN